MTFDRSLRLAIAFFLPWWPACAEEEPGTSGTGDPGLSDSRPQQLRGECSPGSRIGGWKKDAIYIISMMGGVYEVVLGVQGAPQPHLP